MQSSPCQFDHKPWYGWSISTLVHLSLIIAAALLLMPSGDGSSELLEARALYRLTLAKMLQDTAKPSMARRYYERVAHDYPDTRAAKEALASLEQLSDFSDK